MLERLRVVDQLRRGLDRCGAGTRFHDAVENVLLGLNRALHGVHQVGHQVGAALILVQHFRPSRSHLLILLLQPVVTAPGQQRTEHHQQTYAQNMQHDGALHNNRR